MWSLKLSEEKSLVPCTPGWLGRSGPFIQCSRRKDPPSCTSTVDPNQPGASRRCVELLLLAKARVPGFLRCHRCAKPCLAMPSCAQSCPVLAAGLLLSPVSCLGVSGEPSAALTRPVKMPSRPLTSHADIVNNLKQHYGTCLRDQGGGAAPRTHSSERVQVSFQS